MQEKNGGFVQLIIIIVLSVIILSLLGVSISSLINNTTLRSNFSYLFNWIVWFWNTYAGGILRWVKDLLSGLHEGAPRIMSRL